MEIYPVCLLPPSVGKSPIVKHQSSHVVYLNIAQNNKPVEIWTQLVMDGAR